VIVARLIYNVKHQTLKNIAFYSTRTTLTQPSEAKKVIIFYKGHSEYP